MKKIMFENDNIAEPIVTEADSREVISIPSDIRGKFKVKQKINISMLQHIKAVVLLIIGAVLVGIATDVIYLPFHFTMGGIAGIGSIIYYAFGQVSFGTLFFVLNIPLLIIGWIKINRTFVWRCIIGISAYAVIINLLEPIVAGWTEIIKRPINGLPSGMLVYAIMAGFLGGLGIGLILKAGFMTGGSDILAILLQRIWPNISLGRIMMIIDMCIISSTLFFSRNSDPNHNQVMLVVYSLIALFIAMKMVDVVLSGLDFMRSVYIISDSADLIANQIMLQLERGVTAISGHGMYTGKEKKILLCVVSNRQIGQLQLLVDSIDPQAFMIFYQANEVRGQGFNKKKKW